MSAMEEQKLAVDIIICSRQTSIRMVRERYNKASMNYTNTATKIVQSVSRCCELTVSDSSSVGRTPTAAMVVDGVAGSIPAYPIYPQ